MNQHRISVRIEPRSGARFAVIEIPLLEDPYETDKFIMLAKTSRFEQVSGPAFDGMELEAQILLGARKEPRKGAQRATDNRPAYQPRMGFEAPEAAPKAQPKPAPRAASAPPQVEPDWKFESVNGGR